MGLTGPTWLPWTSTAEHCWRRDDPLDS